MTLREAKAQGFNEYSASNARGYRKKCRTEDEYLSLPVFEVKRSGGGRRKGELYVEVNNPYSTRYHFRIYLRK